MWRLHDFLNLIKQNLLDQKEKEKLKNEIIHEVLDSIEVKLETKALQELKEMLQNL